MPPSVRSLRGGLDARAIRGLACGLADLLAGLRVWAQPGSTGSPLTATRRRRTYFMPKR